MIVLTFCIVIILIIYLYRVKPNTGRRNEMQPFLDKYIAHRGLFDNDTGSPENSLPAFSAAVEKGYGIELDVQMTTDHKLVVFHDDNLKRMCGVNKPVYECSYDELLSYKLGSSDENIPLFDDVLQIINGSVLLIVEIKSAGDWKGTTERVAKRMDSYKGVYCMESFHPLAVEWYKKNRPEIIRGQLADDFFRTEEKMSIIRKIILSSLLMNNHSRPDFIAYNFEHADQWSFFLCRKLFSVVNVAWTPRSQEQLETAKKIFDVFIFDSFIPDSFSDL